MSPDTRKHRGPNQKDLLLFADRHIPVLCAAARDYLWLLNGGYPIKATLKLVGDQYALHQRQRSAIARSICSDEQKNRIHSVQRENLIAQSIFIDGFNTIITLEAMVCQAPIFICRDQTLRDLAGIHGSYHKIVETPEVIRLVARALEFLKPSAVTWFFDRPVSNSGRLAALVKSIGQEEDAIWECLTTDRTDQKLMAQKGVLVSADSGILLNCAGWFNLTRFVKDHLAVKGWFIDLLS
ncbi:MAG: DUF434 domain-containing protein [Marinilabiliaceae bacterium]|nr:DUF434 domain-containing protein [Marinilabiliaceae bacterium]